MSAYSDYKKRYETAVSKSPAPTTIGQKIKAESDKMLEKTWNNDVESRVCYIYDYYHDDQPDKRSHMTYENTTKTHIDAKFILKSHQSLDSDQTAYYLQFKPSQPLQFEEGDELYYFETDYRRTYNIEFPIGLYVDIPNEKNIYEKWIILGKEISNQFTKYLILPIDYRLQWIERDGQSKIKRQMWGTTRSQSSYNVCASYWKRYVESFLIAGNSLNNKDNQQRSFLLNEKNVQRASAGMLLGASVPKRKPPKSFKIWC